MLAMSLIYLFSVSVINELPRNVIGDEERRRPVVVAATCTGRHLGGVVEKAGAAEVDESRRHDSTRNAVVCRDSTRGTRHRTTTRRGIED